mgnify:CR=1 FL=1
MNALERPPVAPGLSAGRPTPKEPRLPPLREDLRLHEGPDADDGSPTWVLEDPARDQFFQLGVLQAECLKRWHLGTARLWLPLSGGKLSFGRRQRRWRILRSF